MYAPTILLLLGVAGCFAQIPEGVSIESSQVGEREPFFFFTLTLTVTSTLSTATTVSTATTCTSLSSTTACAGKRRRRAILMGDEEYFEDKIVQPSAVSEVEATVAPVVAVEPKREAREAQYYPEYFYPQMMPSYLQAPYVPKFNPFYAAMVNPFRQAMPAQGYQPNERFFLSYSTSTITSFTTTVTSFTATSSLVLLCSASGSTLSAC